MNKREEPNHDEFYTLPSAMNEVEEDKIYIPELEQFEILESEINTMTITNPVRKQKAIETPIEIPELKKEKPVFNHREFLADVKEQMHDLGLDASELSQITYIPQQRMKGFLHYNRKLSTEEIKEIKKKLYISY